MNAYFISYSLSIIADIQSVSGFENPTTEGERERKKERKAAYCMVAYTSITVVLML